MNFFYLILFALYFSKPAASQCNAGFTYTISESFVVLYASDSAAGKQHFWSLGDGTTQTSINPHQQYFPGTYLVKHVVYDSSLQCKDSVIQEITISYEPSCYSSFYYSRSQADPNHITFYPVAYAYGTIVTQLTWSINGAPIAASSDAWEHSFLPPQQYIVTLTAVTSSGCSSTFTDTIATFRQCDLDVDFETSIHPENARVVRFEPKAYDSSLRYILTTMGTQFPCCQYNTFSEPGNYAVTMVATDSVTGCFDTVTHIIAVKGNAFDSCTASLTVTEKTPGQYALSAISNQPVTQQYWKICDVLGMCDSIQTISDAPVLYSFRDTGSYTIQLVVVTQTGCTKEIAEAVQIQNAVSSAAKRLSAYPNPAQNETALYVHAEKAAPVTVTVYNNTGKPVYSRTIPGVQGKNKLTIPAQPLPKGQYYVRIESGERTWKSVFQKL